MDVGYLVNNQREIYTYDENNNRIVWLDQYWSNSIWKNSRRWTYTYDENNNQIEYIDQHWYNNLNTWRNYAKHIYTYEEILAITISDNGYIPNHYNLSQSYPNPFNPTTTIQYELPKNTFVNITIYDLLVEK